MKKLIVLIVIMLTLCINNVFSVEISVDTSQKHQLIQGWEAVAWAGDTKDPAFLKYRDAVIDSLVAIGVNRLRLEVRAGSENDVDYWQQYMDGIIEYHVWREHRYATVNDDSDPENINWDGFHFSELDNTIENIVIPWRKAMTEAGKTPLINLNYVAFTSQNAVGTEYIHDEPQEYAEFILAVYEHIRDKYGFLPTSLEILLEPDNVDQWNGTKMGEAIVATGLKLLMNGFIPSFIAPSTASMHNAITYFNDMIAVPGAKESIGELSYHRYGGVSEANLNHISRLASVNKISTSMLEWWSGSNNYKVLMEDLIKGENSVWQQGVICGKKSNNPKAAFFVYDDIDTNNIVVEPGRMTKTTRLFYENIPLQSIRVGAEIEAPNTVIVTKDYNGFLSFIVVTEAAEIFSFKNLFPGEYSYTCYNTNGAEILTGSFLSSTMDSDSVFDFNMPGITVIKQVSATGIVENSENPVFRITPNPAENSIEITLDGHNRKSIDLSIFDNSGRVFDVIEDGYINGDKIVFKYSTKELSSGIYYISVKQGGIIQTEKLIIVK